MKSPATISALNSMKNSQKHNISRNREVVSNPEVDSKAVDTVQAKSNITWFSSMQKIVAKGWQLITLRKSPGF